jgi:hypothetical protein
MNVSNEKRPTNHGQGGLKLVPQTTSVMLLDQPELDLDLSEKFSAWLEPKLDALVDLHSAFVTADSLKRDLRRR